MDYGNSYWIIINNLYKENYMDVIFKLTVNTNLKMNKYL